MKWIMAVLVMVGTAEARLGVDIEWGFMQGKAIFVSDSNGNMKGGSNWEFFDINFTAINRDSTMMAYGFGSQGFRAKSSVLTSAGVMTVDVESYMISLQAMKFLTPPGQKTRFYVRGGPALTHLEATVSAGGLLGLGISNDEWRPGFRLGIGATQRMTKSIVLVGNMGYTYVNVDGTLDPSLFTATIGLGFGG
jgi:opacity protein-like surface antigen